MVSKMHAFHSSVRSRHTPELSTLGAKARMLACCYDKTLIFLEYDIVAKGRRSMNVDVADVR
jgi:hypothetical protein